MGNIAIQVEGLGKRYLIGARQAGYRTMRESVAGLFSSPLRKRNQAEDEHWALRDVSFEVKHGEVVGIIGQNGAGKSTLLKILSRIAKPTTGLARVCGRVGSLLEVGTGFHPELSGRENVYMNGAILGMSKMEIDRKFDEIVAFAEVEKFLETPVKRYSSGMQLRLGFAVAAHLEPEIMIVDEVLAVGDTAFQQKCLGKMKDVARESRTVLFVSHNLPAVTNLCGRAITLQGGCVAYDGDVRSGVDRYLGLQQKASSRDLSTRKDRRGTQQARFSHIRYLDPSLGEVPAVRSGDDVIIDLSYECDSDRPLRNVQIGVDIFGDHECRLMNLTTTWTNSDLEEIPPMGAIRCKIPHLPLMAGEYRLDTYFGINGEMADFVSHAATLTVQAADYYGSGKLPTHGYFLADHSWEIERCSKSHVD